MLAEPYPEGARVHHRAGLYSRGAPDLGPYWGVVLAAKPVGDSWEYKIERAEGHIEGAPTTTWWGSHHIDQALPPEKGDADG